MTNDMSYDMSYDMTYDMTYVHQTLGGGGELAHQNQRGTRCTHGHASLRERLLAARWTLLEGTSD